MMSVGTRIYVAIFLLSLVITLASVLVLEIYEHPTAALILHPLIVLITAVSLMANCQYQKRRHGNPGIESGSTSTSVPSATSMGPSKAPDEDPPPQYELPPTYTEAVTKSIYFVQQARNEELSKL